MRSVLVPRDRKEIAEIPRDPVRTYILGYGVSTALPIPIAILTPIGILNPTGIPIPMDPGKTDPNLAASVAGAAGRNLAVPVMKGFGTQPLIALPPPSPRCHHGGRGDGPCSGRAARVAAERRCVKNGVAVSKY